MKLDTAIYLIALTAALACYSAWQSSPPEVEEEATLPPAPRQRVFELVRFCPGGGEGCAK